MKMGIGIGWPNSTSSWGGVYPFVIEDCTGIVTTVYSESPEFLPEAFIFEDPELTIPFSNGRRWNLTALIYSIGGYGLSGAGEVKNDLAPCPI